MGQEVGGKGVAQHVRRDGLADSRRPCRFFDDLPEPESGHGAAPVADKKDIAAPALEDQRAGGLKIVPDDFPGRNAKGNEPLLVTLADYPDKAGGEIAGRQRNGDQLRDPDPGGVEQVQHGIVSLGLWRDGGRRGQESGDFVQGQGLGELTADPGKINGGQGVVRGYAARLQKGKEAFKGRDPSGVTARGQLTLAALFQEEMKERGVNLVQACNFLLTEKGEKKINISLIGLDGIVGQAFFSNEIIEKERLGGNELLGDGLRGDGQRCIAGSRKRDASTSGEKVAPDVVLSGGVYALRVRLNFRSFLRASACLRRFIMLGFS